MPNFAEMTRPTPVGKLVFTMLRKKNAQIENLETQVQALMKQRAALRDMVKEQRELLEEVAASEDPELAVKADLLLTEMPA